MGHNKERSEVKRMGKIRINANVFTYPMPVVLVGAMVKGKPNFMAVGWVSRVNANPPMLAVGISRAHHTPKGIKENGTLSVNIPSADMVDKVDYCGLVSGRTVDKAGIIQIFYGDLKTAPMIEECPIRMECKVLETIELPSINLIIGQIMAAFAEEKGLTDDKPDVQKIDLLVLTMPDNRYWGVGKYAGAAWEAGKSLKA
jgi:flavin reductase (DIM6/NTAB) family NADH-FMN oxidoreductase RutF